MIGWNVLGLITVLIVSIGVVELIKLTVAGIDRILFWIEVAIGQSVDRLSELEVTGRSTASGTHKDERVDVRL